MKTYRVTMHMDVCIPSDVTEEIGGTVAETVERVLCEGEPYVGEGGIEIVDMELIDEDIEEEIDNVTPIVPRPTKYSGYTNLQLMQMAEDNGVIWEPADHEAINRMRLIMALRSAEVLS